jgi:hypothetical protein
MTRQGVKARDARHRQDAKGRKDARHRQGIGKASAIAIGIGIIIGNCHRHRHAIGMPSRHYPRHAIIGMPSSSASAGQGIGKASASAGRRTAKRSKVAQYSHTDFERVLRCAVVKIFE